jgi:uncharacterized membrane protein
MVRFHPTTLLDKTYEIGLVVKFIDGLFELIGGILVLSLSANTIHGVTRFLTENALQSDPHNFIATHIQKAGEHLAAGHNLFAAAFLLTHGIVKIGLVVLLFLNRTWVYPWALGLLGLFLIYQFYQLFTAPTFGMGFLTALDIIILWLINREWQKVKQGKPVQAAET